MTGKNFENHSSFGMYIVGVISKTELTIISIVLKKYDGQFPIQFSTQKWQQQLTVIRWLPNKKDELSTLIKLCVIQQTELINFGKFSLNFLVYKQRGF